MAQNLEATSQNMRELHPTGTTSSSKQEASNNEIHKFQVAQAKPETKPQRKQTRLVIIVENLDTNQPAAISKKQLATSVVRWAT